jgi:hypothetical protein
MTADGIVAIFTIVIAIFACLTWQTYKAILEASKTTERAYVTMSHASPGLSGDVLIKDHQATADPESDHDISISIKIANKARLRPL